MKILPYTVEKFNQRQQRPILTLSISIYNNISFFEKVFASIESQTLQNFEVIIADDGSKSENKIFIQNLIEKSLIPCTYVWQEDRGFHKNEVLNKGILAAQSEYIVFIDGDCILHRNFLEDHYIHRKKKSILAGRRANLSEKISRTLTPELIKTGWLDENYLRLMPHFLFDHDSMAIRGIRITSNTLWKFLNRKKRGVVGCNFSVHVDDLIAINGFDMRYNAAGTGEDSDVEYRLNQSGVETLPFCHKAVQYHLWHKLQDRDPSCEILFESVKKSGKAITNFGLNLLK